MSFKNIILISGILASVVSMASCAFAAATPCASCNHPVISGTSELSGSLYSDRPGTSAEASVYHAQGSKYPKFLEVTMNPLDVKVGDTQKIIARVEDPAGIDRVEAKIDHDAGTDTVELALTKEAWSGEWKVRSTHSETYRTIFIARNTKQEEKSLTVQDKDRLIVYGDNPVTFSYRISAPDVTENQSVKGIKVIK